MTTAPSRREFLKYGGTAALAPFLGVAAWEGSRQANAPRRDGPRTVPTPEAVIDCHVHLASTGLPGVPGMDTPTPDQLRAELDAANVTHALCMPVRSMDEKDPLGVAATRRLAERLPGRLHPIGMADPQRIDKPHLTFVEKELERGDVVALKAYLGYLHVGPEEGAYRPYYQLAAKYRIRSSSTPATSGRSRAS